jgi:hypothetical protein
MRRQEDGSSQNRFHHATGTVAQADEPYYAACGRSTA